jgi:transcriptional regulator with XRE-family HTH domain
MTITATQIRAARVLIKWSQSKLAAETGVSLASIAKFEAGGERPSMLDLSVVQRMLKDAGVEFIEGEPSVKLREKKDESKMTDGQEPIAIPAWVPLSLRTAYSDIAARYGEEEAASQIRLRKRSMTPRELNREAEVGRRIKLGFKGRFA